MTQVYGALPGGVHGLGAMSVPQIAGAFPIIEAFMTNIHLADRDPQHHSWASKGIQPRRLRILLSYHYYKDTDLDALFAKYFTAPYPEVFLDSGAFSASTQGTSIDLAAYCAYIKRYQHLVTTYAVLDVIGNAQAGWLNQQRMEAMGLQPLPCFHVGEAWDYFERYVERYPYLALGGMVPYMRDAKKRLMPWLIKCFKGAQGKTVFHGFGCTSWTVVKALPWYSVDSSSWGQGFRYGQIPLFDEHAGRFVDVGLGNKAQCYAQAPLFRRLGFDPGDFADRARNDRSKICAISALSYMMAEDWLRKRHGAVLIPARDDGNKMFLADANPQRFIEADAGLKLHIADTSNGLNYRDAATGLRTYLADARGANGGDLAAAEMGLKIHLAEHLLDKGGIGDTSRALDYLKKGNDE